MKPSTDTLVEHCFPKMTIKAFVISCDMATLSSILAWRIPGTGKPGGQHRVEVTQSWTQLKRLNSSNSDISEACHSIKR